MKNIRHLLLAALSLCVALVATAQSKKSAPVTPDAHAVAVEKTSRLNQELNLTPDQQTQVVAILEKYDDPNTATGNTPYTITEHAEREVMEILDQQQQQYYEDNMMRIRNSLRMGSAVEPATPADKATKKSKKSKVVSD
ncbi:MAG: hypothetical protein ACKO1U_03225 [Bacteroidota bacterium]